jgi:hypothetical protein
MILGGPKLNQNYLKTISSVETFSMEWKAFVHLCERTAFHAQVTDETFIGIRRGTTALHGRRIGAPSIACRVVGHGKNSNLQ